ERATGASQQRADAGLPEIQSERQVAIAVTLGPQRQEHSVTLAEPVERGSNSAAGRTRGARLLQPGAPGRSLAPPPPTPAAPTAASPSTARCGTGSSRH